MATNLTYTKDPDGTGVDYNVGTTVPKSARLQDINGDGKLDLLVAGDNGASVSLGNGDGTFAPRTVYTPNGTNLAKDVQAADIDGDGKQDLLVFDNTGTNTFTLYKGNGDGTFANAQAITWNSGGSSSIYGNNFTLADITGDGKIDIVVADGNQNYATLLTNTSTSGNFSFTAGTSIGPFSQTLRGGIYVTDVDGDNDQDVIVMKANVDIAVLTNTNGVLSLGTPLVSIPDGVFADYGAAGDLNGDGKPDIAFANNSTLYLALSGTDAYTVSAPISLGTIVRALAIADGNADGKQDVVVTYGSVSGSGVDKVAVLLGNGDGTLQTATTVVSTSIKLEQKGTAVGDLNGDGHPDLVVVNGKNGSTIVGNASVYLNSSVSGPTTTFSALVLSADTGSSNSDFITNTAAQTLTATLSGTLATGDVVQGSLDNGNSWTDITSKVSNTTLTWDGITLAGSNTLKLKVTNNGLDGTVASQAYVLDALAPSPTLTAASLKVSTNAVVQSSEIGTAYLVKDSVTVTDLSSITGAADNNFNSVAISAANTNTNLALTGLVDGTYKLYTVDTAGNLSAASSTSVKIDSLAPTDVAVSSTTTAIAANATVGNLSATDATTGDTFTYSLVTNTGDNTLSADNAKFAISNGSLVVGTNALTDNTNYKITVRATDAAGNIFDKAFTITAVDAPVVSSIVRNGGAPQNNNQTVLDFRVSFSKDVSNVDASDFTVVKGANVTGTPIITLPSNLNNNSQFYLVRVAGLTGLGEVQLQLNSSGTEIVASTGGAALVGGFTAGEVYNLDTIAPSVTLSNLALSNDTGTAGDFITKTASQTITATLSAPLETGGTLWATYGLTARGGGFAYVDITNKVNGTSVNWTGVTLLSGGTIQFTAKDALGNTSSPFGTQTYTVKTVAPNAPTFSGNGYSNSSTPTLTGTAEANAIVTVVIGGATFTTTASSTGAWSVNTASAQPTSGTYTAISGDTNAVAVTVTDGAGNSSGASSFNLAFDNTAPNAPTLSGNGYSNTDTPTLTGTAEAGANVSVVIGGATYSVTADNTGAWTVNTATATPTSGTYTAISGDTNSVAVTVTDAAGNSSNASFNLAFDNTAPNAPTLSGNGYSNTNTPTLTGTAEAGANVSVVIGGATYTTTANPQGTWTVNTATATPTSGTYTAISGATNSVAVTVTDAAGNSSNASFNLAFDNTAPSAPTLSGNGYSNSSTPTLTGTAEAGANVSVVIGGATYSVTSDNTGAWSIDTATATPTAGTYTPISGNSNALTVTTTDAAGNSSNATSNLVFDNIAPVTPSIAGNGFSNTATPTISGTAEANSTVTVVVGGATYRLTADAQGAWSVNTATATPASGTYTPISGDTNAVAVTVTDAAGNSSNRGFNLAFDNTAPNAPTLSGNGYSNSSTPTLTGTAEAGANVSVVIGGATYSVTSDNTGAWSIDTATATPTAGTYTPISGDTNAVAVTVTDAAGNSSNATSNLVFDNIAPVTPSIAGNGFSNTATPTISGTAEANSTVTVVVGGATYRLTADAQGAWSVNTATATPASGTYTPISGNSNALTVTTTDAAGNSSNATSNLVFDITIPTVETIDGVNVETGVVVNQEGVNIEKVTILPISDSRLEDPNTENQQLADIPLFWGESTRTQASTVVSLPTGVGLITEGARAPDATQNAVTTLNQLIDSTVASTDTSKTNMLFASDSFLQALSQTNAETLVINKVTITTADNATVASTTPIVISGTNKAVTTSTGVSQTPTEALVIDTRALPKGSVIDLQNIEFAVIVGDNVTIRGGDGANVFFAGAGNQNIRLGADDDELHAGDGDDWVGSQGGDDKLFGDLGNDVLYGGAGNDTLDGGTGTDIALFQYALNQYQVKQNSDGTWTISHAIEGTDTLKDIEFAEFANQTITLSGSNQWMNQLFNQSYGLF